MVISVCSFRKCFYYHYLNVVKYNIGGFLPMPQLSFAKYLGYVLNM